MLGSAAADDVGSVTTSSQAPSTSQCRSTPSLKSDPLEASIVRGDPRDDAPEPEAAYGSDKMEDKSEPDEMEDACEPGETEDSTRNLDEQFSIVSVRSAVEGPRRSARIVANFSDNDQGEEGEEEADGPLFDSSLIDAVGEYGYEWVG
ncbi:hypothetical protein JG688_00014263 [Phytophthora aleatoria]|uniref:Uncharacterized protein n=1 Tax=Phytophthora aleatoria TaxID=2496075 RepID=A0A8J5IVR1_9STRA|nr:hypothetical protein JG688_00014263 [Phytophthora aleatoria]